jgi:hypothetical protein
MSKLFDLAAFGPRENQYMDSRTCGSDIAHAQDLITKDLVWLRKAVLFNAANCFDTYKSWTAKPGLWSDDLRNCLSPWDNVFVSSGVDHELGIEMGVHVMCSVLTEEHKKFVTTRCHPKESRFFSGDVKTHMQRAHYCYFVRAWAREIGSLKVRAEGCRKVCYLDDSGLFLGASLDPLDGHSADGAFSLAFFAFQLTHCRNIIVNDEPPHRPEMPRGKKNKSPKIVCKTLSITDQLIVRDDTHSAGERPGVSKHICRGHFSHYTEEKPLFGKYSGTFWIPMHIRGAAKHGIVSKEYELASGNQ